MDYQFPCPFCGTLNDINALQCLSVHCKQPLSPAVNVKYALIPEEAAALDKRYGDARHSLTAKGRDAEGDALEGWVNGDGQAVINMDIDFAWEWLMHGSKDYQGYKRSVIQGDRPRKAFSSDRERASVEGLIFGSHEDIIYAALTLNGTGLPSYGAISVVLQTAFIEPVTSMLDENSYNFIKRITAGSWFLSEPFPPGHFATWERRSKLTLAKCHGAIVKGLTYDDAVRLVLRPGSGKQTDEFIELYIYGKISKTNVERIKIPVTLRGTLTGDQLDYYDELMHHYVVEEY